MRTYLFLFAGLLCFSLWAQTNKSTGFGLEIYPHFSNSRLLSGGLIGFREAARIDSLEGVAQGYGLGLFFEQKGEKMGFQLGLRYLYTGYDRSRGPLDFNPGQPSTGPDFSARFRAQFIEIPFYWNFYQALNKKTSFFFSLGLASGIHLKSQTEQTIFLPNGPETSLAETNTTYRGFNIALLTAVGIRTVFSERIAVSLQPNFEYWLRGNALDDEDQLDRNLYNIGLRLGICLLR